MDGKATSAQYADMKPIYLQMAAGLAATFALGAGSACAQQTAPTPQDETVAEPEHWLDAPQTPGDWAYAREPGETFAYFGDRSQPEERHFMIRCDLGDRRVWLARKSQGTKGMMMRIRTETRDQVLTAEPVPMTGMVAVALAASDPLLDAMAITKGRFAVEVEAMEPLYIPAWAEVTRVIEDCR